MPLHATIRLSNLRARGATRVRGMRGACVSKSSTPAPFKNHASAATATVKALTGMHCEIYAQASSVLITHDQ